jgi:hypothetical protein
VVEVLPQVLTQDELERLNTSLPSLTNAPDPSLVGGGSLTWRRSIWKSLLDGFPLRLSVRNAGQGTEIAASAKLGSTATLLFGISGGLGVLAGIKLAFASLLLVGIGSLGTGTSIAILALGGLVGLGGFWLLARLAFRSFVRRSRGRVAAIVDRIRGAIQGMKER